MSDEIALGWLLPLVFLGSGFALLGGATAHAVRTRAFLARAAAAAGEVIALAEEPPTEAAELPTYRPVVAFEAGARRIQFRSIAHSTTPQYEVGESVRVL